MLVHFEYVMIPRNELQQFIITIQILNRCNWGY